MRDEEEIKAEFFFKGDSINYHRLSIKSKGDIKGAIYIPKGKEIPGRIILDKGYPHLNGKRMTLPKHTL